MYPFIMIQLGMGKTIIVVVLFALIIAVGVVVMGERPTPRAAGQGGTFIEDMTVVSTFSGTQQGKLRAERADFTPDMNKAELRKVRLEVTDTVVLALAGDYDMLTGDLRLRDDVRATSGQYELTTSEAYYSSGSVTAEGMVTIVSDNMRITGNGIIITDESMEVRSDVRAEIYQSR